MLPDPSVPKETQDKCLLTVPTMLSGSTGSRIWVPHGDPCAILPLKKSIYSIWSKAPGAHSTLGSSFYYPCN